MRSRPFVLVLGAAALGAVASACSQTGGTLPTPAPGDGGSRTGGPVIPADRFVAARLERAAKIADTPIASETRAGWTYRRAGSSDVGGGGGGGGSVALPMRGGFDRRMDDGGPSTDGALPREAAAPAAPAALPASSGGPAKPAGAAAPPAADVLHVEESKVAGALGGERKAKVGRAPAPTAPSPARPLRAGSTDDNADFAEFLKFLAGYEAKPGMKGQYQPIDVRDRRFVRVVDASGRPVPAAQVAVVDEARDHVVGRGTTYGDGRVPVYPAATRTAGADDATARGGAAGWIVDVRSGGVTSRTHWDGTGDEFTVTLPVSDAAPDLVPIDVAFLIDTTGSMGDEIASIQACLLEVAARIRGISRESDLRVATVLYRDVGDDYLTATYAFTPDVGELDKALRGVTANGGGDGPESLNQGLAETVDGLVWRDGAAKVVFLVADAPPHMDYAGDTPYGETVRAAVGKGIRIHTVAASGIDEPGTLAFRQIAQYTRGKFVFLEYGSAAASAASHGVTGAVKSDNLEDILFEQIRDEVARWGR